MQPVHIYIHTNRIKGWGWGWGGEMEMRCWTTSVTVLRLESAEVRLIWCVDFAASLSHLRALEENNPGDYIVLELSSSSVLMFLSIMK